MNFTEHRKTLKQIVRIKGIGLHSGKEVNLIAHPAPVGTGIVFEYRKGEDKASIPVELSNVVDTSNATTLGDGLHKVQTVEHLLAAVFAVGITDMILEIDSVEVPIMDGSSLPFLEAFESIGYTEFEETIEPIYIKNPMWVVDGDKYLVILPSNEWKVTYTIDFPHPLLKGQNITIHLDRNILKQEILPARTFGFLKDVEALQARGLAMGGSLDNAIVLTQDGYLNQSLRYENECVRHKILDLVGDLSIAGRPIIGHYLASKAGHALDVSMAKLVMSSETGNELGKYKSRRIPLFKRKAAAV